MSGLAETWAAEDLEGLTKLGLRRQMEPLQSAQGTRIKVGGEWLLNFSSNDYLGLAGDPRLAAAATDALKSVGTGAGASRLIVGDTDLHRALEVRIAEFLQTPAAVLFNSGYAANVGILQALCGREDVIFSDELNHASIIDGCRLSRARTVIYPHNDVAKLDELLRTTAGRRKLVCTDSVFSMDGDRARLAELVSVCERNGAALFVDEAHAIGVIGPKGRGLAAELALADRIDIRMGTLGKSVGSFGAFAATSAAVAELLVNRARSFVFSTAMPGAVCAASIAGIDILEQDDLRRANLTRLIDQLAVGLKSTPSSAIFSVILGSPEAAVEAGRKLRAQGLLVKPIRPPTVPEGTSRLRISLSATHTAADVDRLLLALSALPELRRAA